MEQLVGQLMEDLIMLIFMHYLNMWLFVYLTVKMAGLTVLLKNLFYLSLILSIISFGLREFIIFANLPNGIFVILNLILTIVAIAKYFNINYKYSILGILISLAAMLVFSPIAYISVKGLGWEYPNKNIVINIICGYFEMLGLFILSLYLKLTGKTIHSVISGK